MWMAEKTLGVWFHAGFIIQLASSINSDVLSPFHNMYTALTSACPAPSLFFTRLTTPHHPKNPNNPNSCWRPLVPRRAGRTGARRARQQRRRHARLVMLGQGCLLVGPRAAAGQTSSRGPLAASLLTCTTTQHLQQQRVLRTGRAAAAVEGVKQGRPAQAAASRHSSSRRAAVVVLAAAAAWWQTASSSSSRGCLRHRSAVAAALRQVQLVEPLLLLLPLLTMIRKTTATKTLPPRSWLLLLTRLSALRSLRCLRRRMLLSCRTRRAMPLLLRPSRSSTA